MNRTKNGSSFYLKTVSGQLVLLNIFIFILMSLWDSSLLAPSQKALLFWGASDSIKLAQGEFWRVLTGNFVHFGLIHLWFNCLALKLIGFQIENLIGKKLFLLIYLVSGVYAFLASALFNLSTSSGASGAIFGLIGIGLVLENLYNKTPFWKSFNFRGHFKIWLVTFAKTRPFLTLAGINILFALSINLIASFFDIRIKVDNAAHIAGMLCGFLLFYSIVLFSSKKSSPRSKLVGLLLLLTLTASFIFSIKTLFYSDYIEKKYMTKAQSTTDLITSYYNYTQALKVSPSNSEALFQRATVTLSYGDIRAAISDYRKALLLGYPKENFRALEKKFQKEGKTKEEKLINFLLLERKNDSL